MKSFKKALLAVLVPVLLCASVTSCMHKHTIVVTPDAPSTCLTGATRGGSHCSECGEVITPPILWNNPNDYHEWDESFQCTVCGFQLEETNYNASSFSKLEENGKPYLVFQRIYGKGNPCIRIPAEYDGIPVRVIRSEAFKYGDHLTTVVLPDTVREIGDMAFYNCHLLKTLHLGTGLVSIGKYAFADCYTLDSIHIPATTKTIGENAFSGCNSLATVTISADLVEIGDYVFTKCTALTSILYSGTMAQWNEIRKGEGWDYQTGDYTIYCSDGKIPKAN